MPVRSLTNIQGFIMRSYAMPALRVFVLHIDAAADAKRFLADLAPQVSTAGTWTVKPDYCINLSFTFAGLQALHLPAESLNSFPPEFMEGSLARAALIGDTGLSDPGHWMPEFTSGAVHLLVFLFAQSAAARELISARLRSSFTGLTELSSYDGDNLPGDVGHFGYRDGISQPAIDDAPPTLVPTPLAVAPDGEFLFGYPSQFKEFQYPSPQPDALGLDGSFVAFRILEQDCHAFEQFISAAPEKYGLPKELLAAKVCGRWRNGVPLSLSPSTDTPDPPIAPDRWNAFDFSDDPKGTRCPLGSHIRRLNPRASRIAGSGNLQHRIVRRGLPYGPPYDPENPQDGKARGLLGLFIGVSLKDQFEFLMKDWGNTGDFAPGIGGTKDVILGSIGENGGKFVIPLDGKPPLVITGYSQFVRTRAGAYGFLPSIDALTYISQL